MCMKVKQFMWRHVIIVLKPFLDFMFFFKPTEVHNMVFFYVKFVIQRFEFSGRWCCPLFYNQNCCYIWNRVFPSYLEDFVPKAPWMIQYFFHCCEKTMHNSNVVFGVGMSKEETCFKQINVFSFNFLENTLNSFFLFLDLKLIFVTTYLCKLRFNESCHF